MIPLEISEVQRELDKAAGPQKTQPGLTAAILFGSLLLFFALGVLSRTWTSLAVVVLVLFVHEAGHWAGMRLLGYRDLKMFFLPFLGAAVTSSNPHPSPLRGAVVALLGPVPGLLLGGLFLVFGHHHPEHPFLLAYGRASVCLNFFNLLPFLPLDGGRLLDLVLFSRAPFLEYFFRGLAVVALGLLAWILKSIPMGIVASFVLLSCRFLYWENHIARALRPEYAGPEPKPVDIPPRALELLLPHLGFGLESQVKRLTARTYANRARAVWARARRVPPSWGTTATMLLIYVVVLVVGSGEVVVSAHYRLTSDRYHRPPNPIK